METNAGDWAIRTSLAGFIEAPASGSGKSAPTQALILSLTQCVLFLRLAPCSLLPAQRYWHACDSETTHIFIPPGFTDAKKIDTFDNKMIFNKNVSGEAIMKNGAQRKNLTDREIACLQWVSMGKTSWETGVILDIKERTVNFHIDNICKKFNVHSRQAAITTAFLSGLLPVVSEPSSIQEIVLPEMSENR